MSVINDILKTAALRLTNITLDNGYSFDVVKVHLPQQNGEEYTPEHLTIKVTVADEIPREPELDRPGNPPATAYRMPIVIECCVIPSIFDCEQTWDHISSIVHSNMINALTNVPDWYRFNGRCVNAEIQNPEYQRPEDDGGIGSVKVHIDAIYRVAETNHELIRG